MIQGMHHVAVISVNYERAKWFYTQVLQMRHIEENYRSDSNTYKCDLEFADGGRIELFGYQKAPPRPSYPEACGLRHLALRVNDLDAMLSHLDAVDWDHEQVRVDPYTRSRFTFLKDPDETPIELYEV